METIRDREVTVANIDNTVSQYMLILIRTEKKQAKGKLGIQMVNNLKSDFSRSGSYYPLW